VIVEPSTLAVFSAAALALLVVPGPAVTYIVAQSISHGRSAGLASVAGVHAGTMVHIVAATAGLSALLVSSALAFDVVKYLGAAYLILLGIRALLGGEVEVEAAGTDQADLWGLARQGAVVNILNPKTALFFLAFLPQFVDTSRGSASAQILVLGLLFAVLGLFSDAVYAVAAAAARDRLLSNPRLARWRARFTGVVFIALGVTAALTGRRSTR
jgi:threonine/homoserine/homoserine lactone efflux protein